MGRETNKQRDRQAGRKRCRRIERQTSRGTGRRTGGQIGSSETDRQSKTDKLRDRHEQPGRHRQTDIEPRGGQTGRQRRTM